MQDRAKFVPRLVIFQQRRSSERDESRVGQGLALPFMVLSALAAVPLIYQDYQLVGWVVAFGQLGGGVELL